MPRIIPSYKWLKCVLLWLLGMIVVGICLWWLRFAIANAFGSYLIAEDQYTSADQLFVLSGLPVERADAAARLASRDRAVKLVCTGEVQPDILLALDLHERECELTRRLLIRNGVDSSRIELLPIGTSTREEVRAIRAYILKYKPKRIAVLSSRMHTRRIRREMARELADVPVQWQVVGAPSCRFNESAWWESEDGLLFVSNEYIKLAYYLMR